MHIQTQEALYGIYALLVSFNNFRMVINLLKFNICHKKMTKYMLNFIDVTIILYKMFSIS